MKSGGLSMNIGIHFFDLLIWLFGGVQRSEVTERTPERFRGRLELEQADVNWFCRLMLTFQTVISQRDYTLTERSLWGMTPLIFPRGSMIYTQRCTGKFWPVAGTASRMREQASSSCTDSHLRDFR